MAPNIALIYPAEPSRLAVTSSSYGRQGRQTAMWFCSCMAGCTRGLATWHRLIPLLAEHHRVIVPDLRDHGKSDRIRCRFEIADMADDVAAILDALDVGSATVVGWSLGGMVAQELARRHSSRVKSLVLGATAAHPSPLPRWVMVPLAVLLRGVGRLDRLLVPRVSHWYLRTAGAVPGDHGAWVWETLLDRDMTLYHESGFAMLRFDARNWVGSLRMPTTVVIPTSDQMMPLGRQRELADHLSDAVIVELSGARHEALFTHPDDLARVVIDAAKRGPRRRRRSVADRADGAVSSTSAAAVPFRRAGRPPRPPGVGLARLHPSQ